MAIDVEQLAVTVASLCHEQKEGQYPHIVDAALALLEQHHQWGDVRKLPKFVKKAWYAQQRLTNAVVTSPSGDVGQSAADIVSALEESLGTKVETEQAMDPQMIGGVAIALGDERYDLSVRAALDRLAENLASNHVQSRSAGSATRAGQPG